MYVYVYIHTYTCILYVYVKKLNNKKCECIWVAYAKAPEAQIRAPALLRLVLCVVVSGRVFPKCSNKNNFQLQNFPAI